MSPPDGALASPGLPKEADEPVFVEPWQAQAFALAVELNARGVFEWPEWADALSRELHSPDAAPDGSDYYDHWMRALEKLLVAKGVTTSDTVADLALAWQRAAHATPHGRPILLENDPQRS